MTATSRANRVLPTGTVTFLFTDIEGSTRLWETQREAMTAALARHDALLRQCIESRGGHVFKTGGDAFCATFATATDAVGAALAAQQGAACRTVAGEQRYPCPDGAAHRRRGAPR
ncbi:MAG TPA: adenylate/guanylate cyclase domain-containing protein [Casimicrobiaceae bacterium]|nr:adenylate/guanylate cyclase domain-containing protein [Casimicrobiaceae bacterium]